jgi:hypothetical protein
MFHLIFLAEIMESNDMDAAGDGYQDVSLPLY